MSLKKLGIIFLYNNINYLSIATHIKLYNLYTKLQQLYTIDVYTNKIDDKNPLNIFLINKDYNITNCKLLDSSINLDQYDKILICGDIFKNPYLFWKYSETLKYIESFDKTILYDVYFNMHEYYDVFKESNKWKENIINHFLKYKKIYTNNLNYKNDLNYLNISTSSNLLQLYNKNDYISNIQKPSFIDCDIYNISIIHKHLYFKEEDKEQLLKENSLKTYDITYAKLEINQFLYCIYNCNCVYTNDYDLVVLCKILQKKCIYPKKLDYRFEQIDDLEINFLDVDKLQNQISLDYHFNNSIHTYQLIDKTHTLEDIKNKVHINNNVSLFLYYDFNAIKYNIDDICIIQCYCGDNEDQYLATKKAIHLMYIHTNPKPKEWIFVEAQEYDTQFKFEYLKDYNIKYIKKYIKDENKFIHLKTALWNIGVQNTSCSKLCFIDSDVVFCSSNWLNSANEAFDKYTFFQIQSYSYDALQTQDSGLVESISYSHLKYKNKDIYQYNSDCITGHVGYSLCMSKENWKKIHGLRVLPTSDGDLWMWILLIGGCNGFKYYYYKNDLPYNLGLTESFYSTADLYGIDRKIGSCDEVCLHINHNHIEHKEETLFGKLCTTFPYEDIKYNFDEDNLPEWKNNNCGILHKKCLEKFSQIENKNYNDCCQIYDDISEDYYGKINASNKLIIATSFEEGLSCKSDTVYIMKDLYEQYCETPFEFIVFTNSKLKGINTIPFNLDIKDRPVFWNQIEMFRHIFDSNTSILMLDSDVVPLRKFKIHQCPKNKIYLKLELNGHSPNSRTIWNAGSIYYRGNFDFIFQQYKNDIKSISRNPLFHYASSQEYTQSVLFKYNITIENIDQHFRICFPSSNYQEPEKYYQACHFIGYMKPWSFEQNKIPSWCPYPTIKQ